MTKKPTIEFDIVTPERAKEIVEREGISTADFNNRPAAQIKAYATDMAARRWKVNGDALIFDSEGRLIDGRKRLLAAAVNGVSFPTFVIKGIEPDAKDYIDQHKRRSSRDIFHAAGHDSAGTHASNAATIVDIAVTGLPSQQVLSHGNLLRLVEDNKDILDLRKIVREHPLYDHYSPSDLAALIYLTRRIDAKQSDAFLAKVEEAINGYPNIPNGPFRALAAGLKAIQEEIDLGASAGSSKTRYLRVAYTVKTWNAWRTKSDLRKVRFSVDNREVPPRLHGLPLDIFENYIARNDPRAAGGNREIEYRALNGSMDVKGSIETITPEMALEMLLANGPLHDGVGRNRNQSRATIDGYAREMTAGTWKLTGQSIKVSKSGRLLDGQHRLEACVHSGVPFVTFVMRDVDDDVFSTYDVAHQNTLANILKDRDETYGSTIQGAIRWIWLQEEVGLVKQGRIKPNISEMLEVYERYPEIGKYAAMARNVQYRPLRVPPAILNALMIIFNKLDPERAPEFFEKLATGANMDEKHPILRLRTKLFSLAINRRLEIDAASRMYLVCIAWNAFVANKSVTFPRSIHDLAPPEPFNKPMAPKALKSFKKSKPRPQPIPVMGDDWVSTPAA